MPSVGRQKHIGVPSLKDFTRNRGTWIRTFLFCFLASFLLGLSQVYAGEGVFLLGNDTLQLGRASSGVASPRSAYWSYMNPASIVDLDRRIDVNWYSVFSKVKLKPRGLIGNRLDGTLVSDELSNIVSTGFIWPLKTGTLGGGLFIPSGAGVEYPHSRNIISRLVGGNCDRRLAYQHFRGVLSYAYEFENGWAVGLGLHVSMNRFRTDHLTLSLRGAHNDNKWDDAYGAGFGVGFYKRWDQLAFGLNYSSRHWTESMRKYNDLLSAPLDTPRVVQAGFAYKVTPKLELTADFKWLHWRRIRTYGSPIFRGGGYGWTNQSGIKLGVEWKALPKWTLMAGYAYSNSPVRADGVFLSGLVPVVVEQHVTAGISHQINPKNAVHFAAVWAPAHKLRESGTGDLMSFMGKGTSIKTGALSFALGYSYSF
jgi:long-subunit fatty acid transport protein